MKLVIHDLEEEWNKLARQNVISPKELYRRRYPAAMEMIGEIKSKE